MIHHVVLVGGGVLGSQIAYQSAYKGFHVVVYLRSEASIGRAKPKFERLHAIYLEELNAAKSKGGPVSRGLLPTGQDASSADFDKLLADAENAYQSIRYETDLGEAVRGADLVIEALAENPQDKIEFYTRLQEYLPAGAILVTNSSTLLPSMLADSTGRPERFLALHFANNIWRQNTAEVMPASRAAERPSLSKPTTISPHASTRMPTVFPTGTSVFGVAAKTDVVRTAASQRASRALF